MTAEPLTSENSGRTPGEMKTSGKDLTLILILTALSALLLLHGLGDRSLWGSEGRWAEAAREMLAASDYLTPRINGAPYRDKPFLSYDMILFFTPFTGGRVTELSARLPSAVSAMAALLLLYGMGKRLYDRETGFLSSLILGTSFYFIYWGRTASADLINMTGVLLSLWIFVRFEPAPSRGWLYPFYLSMAVNSLTKGLLGFALPMAVLLPYAWIRKQWGWLLNRHTIPAGLFSALIYLIPFFLDFTRSGSTDSLYLVFKENVLRFFDPFDHKQPVYYYFYEIFAIFAPWALFLPGALIHHLRKPTCLCNGRQGPMDGSTGFVILYFCSLFLFFTLSGSRRSYYLLPLFPAASLLLGRSWSDLMREPLRGWRSWVQVLIPAGLMTLIMGSAAILVFLQPSLLKPYEALNLSRHAWAAAITALGLILSILLYAGSKVRHSFDSELRTVKLFAAVLLTVVFCMDLYLFFVVLPAAESFRGLRGLCSSVNRMHIPQDRLAVLHQGREGNLFFYLDQIPVRRIDDPEEAGRFLQDSENYLLIEEKHRKEISGISPDQILLQENPSPFKQNDSERFSLIQGRSG